MKIGTLFFLSFALSSTMFCQNTIRVFIADGWVCGYDLNIHLFPDKTYYLDTDKLLSDDINYTLILSYGAYKKNNGFFYLQDDLYSYQLVAKINGDSFIFINAPDFLKKKPFIFYQYLNADRKNFICLGIDSTITQYQIKKSLENISKNEEPITDFEIGKYVHFDGFELLFHDDYSYKYRFCGEMISKGTWKVKGSFLVLKDDFFKQIFFLSKGENSSVKTQRLPFVNLQDIFRLSD